MIMPKVGQHVVYHDGEGNAIDALVKCLNNGGKPSIDLLLINEDEWGADVGTMTFVLHKSFIGSNGNYWRYPNELPREIDK
jgi:hypothetical protein